MGKFKIGQLVATRAVDERTRGDKKFYNFVAKSLKRHINCDWGDLCDEDKESNEQALKDGGRLFSAYIFDKQTDEKIWIITEWDRSVTTILFPEDY